MWAHLLALNALTKDIVQWRGHPYSHLLCPDASAWQRGHACLHTCSVWTCSHLHTVVQAGPSVNQPSPSATVCWAQPHLCTPGSYSRTRALWHRRRVFCMRHVCRIPVLHCRCRGKTIYILAISCTNIRVLGMPVPTYCSPGLYAVALAHLFAHRVPVGHTRAISQSQQASFSGSTGMPVCAPTVSRNGLALPGSAHLHACHVRGSSVSL